MSLKAAKQLEDMLHDNVLRLNNLVFALCVNFKHAMSAFCRPACSSVATFSCLIAKRQTPTQSYWSYCPSDGATLSLFIQMLHVCPLASFDTPSNNNRGEEQERN